MTSAVALTISLYPNVQTVVSSDSHQKNVVERIKPFAYIVLKTIQQKNVHQNIPLIIIVAIIALGTGH